MRKVDIQGIELLTIRTVNSNSILNLKSKKDKVATLTISDVGDYDEIVDLLKSANIDYRVYQE